MNERVWSNLQRTPKGKGGWQLVGRGKASETVPVSASGRTVRPLTYSEITEKFSAEDSAWHLQHNTKNWQAAFDQEERRRQSKTHVTQTKTKLQWQGNATDEESEQALIAGETFANKFPQFERTLANAQALCRYMQEHDLPGTELSSFITAFRALSEKGELTLAKTESAEEFLKNHSELTASDQVPPMIQARQAKHQATTEFVAKTQAATAKSGSTTVVAYEDEQTGYPAAPNRYSFRKLLDSLSADEYQRRLNEDPQFAAAIDKLNNGNK